MVTIKDYITDVYKDFKQYLDEENYLCDLKSLNYQSGMKPDYDDIHIQQYYLLRYAFSYAFEYKCMFISLFEKEVFTDSIRITSIGCGNLIDYWALVEALKEDGNAICRVKYTGIDVIDWHYKIKPRKGDQVKFIESNAANEFTNVQKLVSDVYIFPKSISEFSKREFTMICKSFETKEIMNDTIYILISIRTDEGSMDRDMDRSSEIISAMRDNGFYTKNDARFYIHLDDEEKGIRAFDCSFEYPDEALDIIKRLNEKCLTFLQSFQNCEEDCAKCLKRWPILKAKNIRYQVLEFHRKAEE